MSIQDFIKSLVDAATAVFRLETVGSYTPEINSGVGVSVKTSGSKELHGYVTLVIDSICANAAEQYKTKQEAIAGHEKWVSLARKITNDRHFIGCCPCSDYDCQKKKFQIIIPYTTEDLKGLNHGKEDGRKIG